MIFKWVIGRIGCLCGRHERSYRHVRKMRGGSEYTSRCTYCGTPMRRLSKRNWIVDKNRH